MKKSLYFLGIVPIIVLGSIFFNSNSNKGSYEPRKSTLISEGTHAKGMLEYYKTIMGEYTREDYLRMWSEAKAAPVDRASMSWIEQGPDNIGGRCRAIIVDKDNINHLYAGSVSGGLFESTNRGNFWSPVTEFNDNLAISSMCQTVDGTIFVATGHNQEKIYGNEESGANGNGLYKMNSDGTFSLIANTDNYTFINEVVCDTVHNEIWMACSEGLMHYDPVGDNLTKVGNGLPSLGECRSLSISPEGDVIVAGMLGIDTYVSQNNGGSFTNYTSSSNTANPIQSNTSGRVEFAISHEKNDNGDYSIYASAANSYLTGVWRSDDSGVNWERIAPANDQSPGSFAPFSTGGGGQGQYDNIISVAYGNPDKIFLGGIDLFSWGTNSNWSQLSQWFLPPQSPQYVHADIHELVWDKEGRLYIGTDGGVIISDDYGDSFYPANRGFNVTQFYAIGESAHGDVIGGTQDNGSLVNYHDNSTWHEFDEVSGGDGFSADISFINRDIVFTSIYYGGVFRSFDRGNTINSFAPPIGGCTPGGLTGGCGSFNTKFALWENPNDTNSKDTITYIPSEAYSANDVVLVPSETNQVSIEYVTPDSLVYDDTLDYDPGLTTQDSIIVSIAPSNNYNLSVFDYNQLSGTPPVSQGDSVYLVSADTIVEVDSVYLIDHYYGTNPARPGKVYDMGNEPQVYGVAWDTVKVQDVYQSWMAVAHGGSEGIWMTRNALRGSAPANDWFKVNHSDIATSAFQSITAVEFSRDGNHLFVGTSTGELWRLSGFGDVYSPTRDTTNGNQPDTLIDVNNNAIGDLVTTWEDVSDPTWPAHPITSIAVEGDVDHVVITFGDIGGSSVKVQESFDATASAPTWGSIHSSSLPSGAYYASVIDRNDPQLIVVGGETGVYCTDNGGTTWANVSGGFGNVPVYDLTQNWRTYNEGCIRPGEIYAGTHGRGIWSSSSFLNTPTEQDNLDAEKFIPNINVYPNPMVNQGTIEFTLETNSDVTVRIFSLNGRMVREFKESNMSKGNNNITFGVSDLAKGTYIVQMRAGEKVETSKFVKR